MEVSRETVNSHHVDHVELMTDQNQMTIEVDSTLKVKSKLDIEPLGDSNLTTIEKQCTNYVQSDEKSCVSCKKRKLIEKLMVMALIKSYIYVLNLICLLSIICLNPYFVSLLTKSCI